MPGDRMVIKRKSKTDLVIDEYGKLRQVNACDDYIHYTGPEEPTCNCLPCWAIYAQWVVLSESVKEQQ